MKYSAMILALVLCALLLCACGKQSETNESTTLPTTTGSAPADPTDPTSAPEQLPTDNDAEDPSLPDAPTTNPEDNEQSENTEDNTFPIPIPSQPDAPEDGSLPPPIEDDGNWGPLF